MKKSVTITLAVIGAIVLIAAVLICTNRKKIVDLMFEKSFVLMEQTVVKNLPQTVSKDNVRAMFKTVEGKIKSGNVDQKELQGFYKTFQAGFKDQKLDSLEVERLLEDLKRLELK